MALSFMLNPRGGKKKRRKAARRRICTKKRQAGKRPCMTVKQKRIMARARKALRKTRDYKIKGGGVGIGEAMSLISIGQGMKPNPRRGRKSKGGRKMAVKSKRRRKSTKRSRAGKKAWRTRLRRYSKKRSSVGRRGYKNNPRKRRRNAWRDDAAGHRKAAKKGWRKRRKNPSGRRRRNSMYSGRLYANPKRRRRNASRLFANPRRGRRRNPDVGGALRSITRSLTDTKTLMQFAVGAAGASVSEMLGSALASKISSFSPTTFADVNGYANKLLGAASRIAAGVLVAAFLPSQYKAAWVMGSGAVAAQPIISGLLQPVLTPIGSALGLKGLAGHRGGIGGWISAAEVYGTNGMGAWLTAQQMPGVGISGMRGLAGGRALGYHGNYTNQPGMQSAFTM